MVLVPPQSFAASSRRAWLPALGGAVVAAAGAWLLLTGRERLVAWTSLGSGAVLAAWFVSPLWRRAPVLWLDDDGLHTRLPGLGCVAWQDLAAVRLALAGRRAFLVLDRAPHARARDRRAPLVAAIAHVAGAADVAIPLDGLTATPARIAAVVELAHAHWQRAAAAAGSARS